MLKDKVVFYGEFSIKTLDAKGNLLDFYEDKNLVMDAARTNMAELIGGVGGSGDPINQFVIGTKGHMDTDILDAQQVGETDLSKPPGNQIFNATKTRIFSEEIAASINYRIPFDPAGVADITVDGSGTHYVTDVAGDTDVVVNTIRRVVSGTIVTYTITIPVSNANDVDPVAYTEAGLYAGTEIFAMKTFAARVKESTAQFIITWSIIF